MPQFDENSVYFQFKSGVRAKKMHLWEDWSRFVTWQILIIFLYSIVINIIFIFSIDLNL